MAKIIFRRYFASRNPGIIDFENDYINDAVTHVVTKAFTKFDFNQNSYSYFQTVIKNCFHENIWNSREKRLEVEMISIPDTDSDEFNKIDLYLSTNTDTDIITREEIIELLGTKFIMCFTETDKLILKTLIQYFKDSFSFSQLGMYLYLEAELIGTNKTTRRTVDEFFRDVLNIPSSMAKETHLKEKKDNGDNEESPDNWFFDVDVKIDLKKLEYYKNWYHKKKLESAKKKEEQKK